MLIYMCLSTWGVALGYMQSHVVYVHIIFYYVIIIIISKSQLHRRISWYLWIICFAAEF